MDDWGPTFEIVKLLVWLLSGFALLVCVVVSVIRSIQERPYGPATEAATETDSKIDSDSENTLTESQKDDAKSSSDAH